ncbi:unnamed protein product [Knipowitschia caucasica]
MSTGPTLRALVTARLTAAAEEIFALFERTIAEYEEELRLCKEKQRRQEQLETLRPRVMLPRADSQTDPQSPGPDLNQEIPETPPIKEEQEFKRVKREKDRRPESVPESSPVSVKKEESSLLQQTELRDEARDEDISTEMHFHSESDGNMRHFSDFNNVDSNKAPFRCSAAPMETEAVADHYHHAPIRARSSAAHHSGYLSKYKSTAGTSASMHTGHMSGKAQGAGERKHRCPFCKRGFVRKDNLQTHIRIHTGERPFSCPVCNRSFSHKSNLNIHIRTHTGEKPHICSICDKGFMRRCDLELHMRMHTGETLVRNKRNNSISNVAKPMHTGQSGQAQGFPTEMGNFLGPSASERYCPPVGPDMFYM